MVRRVLTDEHVGLVRGFLAQNLSLVAIMRRLRQDYDIHVSPTTLSRIKNGRYADEKKEKPEKRGRKRKLDSRQLRSLDAMLARENPPTQRELATRFHVSQSTLHSYIKVLGRAKYKKRRVHALSPQNIANRHKRSWGSQLVPRRALPRNLFDRKTYLERQQLERALHRKAVYRLSVSSTGD